LKSQNIYKERKYFSIRRKERKMRYVIISALFLILAGFGGQSSPNGSGESIENVSLNAELNP